jgi:hypothetical protein
MRRPGSDLDGVDVRPSRLGDARRRRQDVARLLRR